MTTIESILKKFDEKFPWKDEDGSSDSFLENGYYSEPNEQFRENIKSFLRQSLLEYGESLVPEDKPFNRAECEDCCCLDWNDCRDEILSRLHKK